MSVTPLLSAILLMLAVMPALAQSALETHDLGTHDLETHSEAARRQQAERYAEEKDRQNLLAQERQRPLGEAAPSRFSNPPMRRDRDSRGTSDSARPIR